MKKRVIITLAIVASTTLFSCTREPMDGDRYAESNMLQATIAEDAAVTKTIVVDNPGKRVDSYWADGDAMGVFGSGATNIQFNVEAADIIDNGKSANFRSENAVPKGEITAYAPYTAGATFSGGELRLEMPAVQHGVFAKGKLQPDPASNIMVGQGSKKTGLEFHNVLSILKIGQAFDTDVRLVSVEFRDLSSKPVCGSMRITTEGIPQAEIIGSGDVITLDLGSGIAMTAGTPYPVYMYVPSREYPKGFEITFNIADGSKVVHTVGSKMGKTLERSVIYTIGDLTVQDYVPGATSVLADNAILMTSERLDMVTILNAALEVVHDDNGEICYDGRGAMIYMPEFEMLVHKDLPLAIGNLLVFEGGVDQLPSGGVYRVVECEEKNDQFNRVYAKPVANTAMAYKEVVVGGPMFDDNGKPIEGAGVDIDWSSCLQSIVDERGNEVPFSIDGDGNIVISESDISEALGVATKHVSRNNLTFPKLSINVKRPHGEVALGAQMSASTKFAVGVMQGEFQYVYFTFHPVMTFSLDFSLKAEFSIKHQMHLFTMYGAPIPVVPGLFLCPEVKFTATVGVGGDLKVNAALKYDYDMGMYGFAYNKGAGFTFRHDLADPSKDDSFRPEIPSLNGSIFVFGTLSMTPYMSLTGLFGAGLECSTTLKFSSIWDDTHHKLALTPEIEFAPITASLGGLFSKKWENLTTKFEFDPIWEMNLKPVITASSSDFRVNRTEEPYYIRGEVGDYKTILGDYFPCGLELGYRVTLHEPYFQPLKIALDHYVGDIHYYPYEWPGWEDGRRWWRLDLCQAAGVPHISHSILGLDNPKLVSREILGVFPSDETGEITGKQTGFESGKGHGYTLSMIYPDGTEEIISGGEGTSNVQLEEGGPRQWMTIPGSQYHPAIYYWPFRANGQPYYTSMDDLKD